MKQWQVTQPLVLRHGVDVEEIQLPAEIRGRRARDPLVANTHMVRRADAARLRSRSIRIGGRLLHQLSRAEGRSPCSRGCCRRDILREWRQECQGKDLLERS